MNHTTNVTAKLVPNFFQDMTGLFNSVGWTGLENLKVDRYGSLKRINFNRS